MRCKIEAKKSDILVFDCADLQLRIFKVSLTVINAPCAVGYRYIRTFALSLVEDSENESTNINPLNFSIL